MLKIGQINLAIQSNIDIKTWILAPEFLPKTSLIAPIFYWTNMIWNLAKDIFKLEIGLEIQSNIDKELDLGS